MLSHKKSIVVNDLSTEYDENGKKERLQPVYLTRKFEMNLCSRNACHVRGVVKSSSTKLLICGLSINILYKKNSTVIMNDMQ